MKDDQAHHGYLSINGWHYGCNMIEYNGIDGIPSVGNRLGWLASNQVVKKMTPQLTIMWARMINKV